MSKIVLELSPRQVEGLAEKLSIVEKLRLARKLARETWTEKFDAVASRMRRTVKKAKISHNEINRLCNEVKREYDEKHCRH